MNERDGTRAKRLSWGVAGVAIAVLCLAAASTLCAHPERKERMPGHDAPSSIVIAPPEEPGERLVVRGRVYAPDGETPVAGVVLYVYHTGADGLYAPPGERTPRLRGWMRTDAEGRYEYRTIRPGSYPRGSNPAHIHPQLWGAGYEPQWNQELQFADDPLIGETQRRRSEAAGRFANVCAPRRTPQGELLCTQNLRLKPRGDRFDPRARHGFEDP